MVKRRFSMLMINQNVAIPQFMLSEEKPQIIFVFLPQNSTSTRPLIWRPVR